MGDQHHFIPGGFEIGVDDLPVTGVYQVGYGDLIGIPVLAQRDQSAFRQSRAAVVMGGRGNIHAQKIRDHGLEFVNTLKGSLADFRLVGGVGCGKFRTGHQVGNDGRNMMIVITGPDKTGVAFAGDVFRSKLFHVVVEFPLAHGLRQVQAVFDFDGIRNGFEQVIQRAASGNGQHLLNIFLCVRQITHDIYPFSISKYAALSINASISDRSDGLTLMIHPL